jgi:hypothetical protein
MSGFEQQSVDGWIEASGQPLRWLDRDPSRRVEVAENSYTAYNHDIDKKTKNPRGPKNNMRF